jgi:glyoxylase-like metal-dependent hydrolase (beta-lactamase superfamily II)
VRQNLLNRVGSLAELHLFSLNHQDPDVVANLQFLAKENDHLTGIMSEDVWRLVRHLNVSPKKLYFTGKASESLLRLSDGHRIQVVPTPFCHFRGAVAYYDLETRVLFSGDLFAGLNHPGRVQLWAEEEDWSGIAQWHQIYMPSRAAVEFSIRQIRALQPAVEIIAPQHGFLLTGEFMNTVLDRLAALPVGIDLLPFELDDRYLTGYREIFDETIHETTRQFGRTETLWLLENLPAEHELNRYIQHGEDGVALVACGIRAIPLLVEELSKKQIQTFRSRLKDLVLRRCMELKLPIPQLGVGVEEQGA